MGFSQSPGGEKSTMWWSDTDRNIPISTRYRFSAMVRPSSESGSASGVCEYKAFIWKRTSRLELVDEATNVVAAIVHDMAFDHSKRGSLEVLVSYGPNFNLIALTTFLTICERLKEDAEH